MSDGEGLSRRTFLTTVAALGGATAFGLFLPESREGAEAASTPHADTEVSAWVVVKADNSVTFRIPQAELGQGVTTTIVQLVAEELYLDPASVHTEFFDPTTNILRHNVFVYTATLSSLSADKLFDPARIAGAQVRTMMLQAAGKRLKVPIDELEVADARVRHRKSKRSLSFADLAPETTSIPIPAPEHVQLKSPAEWRYIGKSVKRLDQKAKVNGSAIYGIDVRLPGMKFASIRQSPVFGGRLKSFHPESVLSRPGIRSVFKVAGGPSGLNEPPDLGADDWGMDDAVAVVADNWWQANTALQSLAVEWESGRSAEFNSEILHSDMANMLDRGGFAFRSDGDASLAMTRATKTMQSDYWFPYMEHAALEPMNCTARMDADHLEVWAPTQFADEAVRVAAYAAGLPIERVTLHLTYVGGGFGRRICSDFVSQAVQIAKQMPGIPVKLLWSREETTRKGYYPAPAAGRFRGGLDSDGNLIAWLCTAVFAKKIDQSYAAARFAEVIPNAEVGVSTVDTPVPFGWMRGVAWTQFAWMSQCFLDELAHAARRDPLDFQLTLLREDLVPPSLPDRDYAIGRIRGLRRALKEAASRAGWGETLPPRRGRGLAVSDFSYWSGYRTSSTAAVVDVTLDEEGWLRVDRVVIALDCGIVVNPDVVLAQVQGSVGWALSNALYSEITIAGGQVVQGSFDTYPILCINEMPKVEAYILPSENHPSGVGEDAVPVTIGALVNAIAAAGGPRIRSLPIIRHKPLLGKA